MKSVKTFLASAESVFFVYFLVGCRLVVLSGDRNHIDAGQSLFAVLASAQFLDLLWYDQLHVFRWTWCRLLVRLVRSSHACLFVKIEVLEFVGCGTPATIRTCALEICNNVDEFPVSSVYMCKHIAGYSLFWLSGPVPSMNLLYI